MHEKRYANPVRKFFADAGGAFAIWASLAMPAILVSIGAGVDYSNAASHHNQMQSALDAAVLAAAPKVAVAPPGRQSAVATSEINAYLAANFNSNGISAPVASVTVNAASGTTVTATATSRVPTYIMGAASGGSVPISVTAQVQVGGGPAEVAIVFDTTYSMTEMSANGLTKLANAQADAVSLVNTLFTTPSGAANTNMKVSLVPFGVYVDVGTTYAGASWVTNTSPQSYSGTNCGDVWTTAQTCVNSNYVTQTCTYDTVPYDCSYWNQTCTGGVQTYQCTPYNYTVNWQGCVGTTPSGGDMVDTLTSANPAVGILNYWCASPLQRLSTDKTSLISQINALTAQDVTYIPEGLTWGWRTLSPNGPFGDGAAYNAGTRKYLILMTDGYNTNEPNLSSTPNNDWANDGAADANTTQICANIKAAGITIYAIAFEVTSPTIQGILQSCASTPPYYFNATTTAQLQSAFASIGVSVAGIRLTK